MQRGKTRTLDGKMRFVTFRCGPWRKLNRLERLLTFPLRLLRSKETRDYTAALEQVVDWWFEIDENGIVRREIAFDASGEAIAAAPLGDNWGVFGELDEAPRGLGPEVDQAEFEATWQRIHNHWRYARVVKQ